MELLRRTRGGGGRTGNPRQRYGARRRAKPRVPRERQLPTDHCLAVKPAYISMIIDDIAASRSAAKEGRGTDDPKTQEQKIKITKSAGFQINSPPAFHNHSPPYSPACVTG